MRRALAVLVLLAAGLASGAPARAADCVTPCPYTGVSAIGDRAGGQLRLPQAVAVDAAQHVFVADQYSGAIQRFGPDASFQLAFGAPGTRDGEFGAIVGLAYDPSDDTIYAADARNDRIQHFTTDGRFLGAFGSRGNGPGQFSLQDGGPVEDPAQGGIDVGLGRVWVADSGNDRIVSFPLDDVRGSRPTTARATIIGAGVVNNPQGLDAAADGRVYVADDLNDVVRVLAADTGAEVGRLGQGPGSAPGQFDGIYDVVRGPEGRIYAVDDNNHRVQVFDPAVSDTQPVLVFGGFGRAPGQLEYPRAMTIGPDAALYVANTADGRVDRFSTGGAILNVLGQDARLPGQFIRPGFLAAAPDGGLGVPDVEGNRVERFGPDATLLGVLGRAGGALDQVRRPMGVAFAADFGSWTVDTDNDRVVRRDATGTPLGAFGSAGAGDGQLQGPWAAAVDGAGAVYISDRSNDRVVRLGPDGALQAIFRGIDDPRGLALRPTDGRLLVASGAQHRVLVLDPADGHEVGSLGGAQGDATALSTPSGVAADALGRTYVSDVGDDRVVRFDADGHLDAVLGEEGTDLGQFERPTGVTVGCDGVLSVGDAENDRVQRFTLPGAPTTPCVPAPVALPTPPAPTPPAPPVETPIPVPSAPRALALRLTAGARTAVLRRRRVGVGLRCDAACRVRVGVTLRTASGRRTTRTLRARVVRLRAGRTTAVTLRLTARDVRVLRRALGPRGSRLRVAVRASASATGRTGATRSRTLAARA